VRNLELPFVICKALVFFFWRSLCLKPPPMRTVGRHPILGTGPPLRLMPHRFESGRRIGRRSADRPGSRPMRGGTRHQSPEPAAAEGHGRIVRELPTDRPPIGYRDQGMRVGARHGAPDEAAAIGAAPTANADGHRSREQGRPLYQSPIGSSAGHGSAADR
jgi:hypothetical protein